jgi:hypothetical protein
MLPARPEVVAFPCDDGRDQKIIAQSAINPPWCDGTNDQFAYKGHGSAPRTELSQTTEPLPDAMLQAFRKAMQR